MVSLKTFTNRNFFAVKLSSGTITILAAGFFLLLSF